MSCKDSGSMKRVLFFLILLFFSVAYSEEVSNRASYHSFGNEYFLSPSLGWGPVGAVTSLDFMYRKHNGFAMFINFNLAIPFTPKAGIVTFSEIYFGYSLKKGNFYATFAGGFMAGGGLAFYRYEKTKRLGFGNEASTSLYVLAMFALRNDYSYFFNEKVGINISHTHGLGLITCRWILDDEHMYIYNFLIKVGPTFKI